MREASSGLLIVSLAALACCGCHSPPDQEELGTVVFEIPQVPGAGQPYPLPELDQPSPKPSNQAIIPADTE